VSKYGLDTNISPNYLDISLHNKVKNHVIPWKMTFTDTTLGSHTKKYWIDKTQLSEEKDKRKFYLVLLVMQR